MGLSIFKIIRIFDKALLFINIASSKSSFLSLFLNMKHSLKGPYFLDYNIIEIIFFSKLINSKVEKNSLFLTKKLSQENKIMRVFIG